MTAPSAASTVKAATVNAVAAMTLGTRAIRPTSSASTVKISDQAATRRLRNSPGEPLFCQGTAPVSIMAALSTPPKVKTNFGKPNLPRNTQITMITKSAAPARPSAI